MEKAKKKASKKKGKKKKSTSKGGATYDKDSASKSPSGKSDLKPKKTNTSFTLAATFLGSTTKNAQTNIAQTLNPQRSKGL